MGSGGYLTFSSSADFCLCERDEETTDDVHVLCKCKHTHTHRHTCLQLPISEEIGETLPELDTEDVWCRWDGNKIALAFAHPLSVDLIQLLTSEWPYLPFEAGSRTAVRRFLAIAICI